MSAVRKARKAVGWLLHEKRVGKHHRPEQAVNARLAYKHPYQTPGDGS